MTENSETLDNRLYEAARIMLASVFLFSGVAKAFDHTAAAAEFADLGVPQPSITVLAVVVFQTLAGALLVVNRWTTPVAVALGGFVLLATLMGHPFWRADGAAFVRETTTALEHLGLIGGLVALVAVDRLKRSRHERSR